MTDTVTGLVWLKDLTCFAALQNWPTAMALAAALADGACGLTDGSVAGDWRLPTTGEWAKTVTHALALNCQILFPGAPTLTDVTGLVCYIGAPAFLNLTPLSSIYWTSTTNELIPAQANSIDLNLGFFTFGFKNLPAAVWPVRDGYGL